jgi:tetratricopeptide (TPR) repeat protein
LAASAPTFAQMSITTFGATDAVLCFENAGDDFSRDTEPCDTALRGSLNSSDRKKTLVNRGIIRNRKGDLIDALDDFNAALEIDSSLAEAYLNRGNSYFLSGRQPQAISDYERSLELGIAKPWAAWYNIGLAREASGDKTGARTAYAKALEVNPGFTAARNKLDRLGPAG